MAMLERPRVNASAFSVFLHMVEVDHLIQWTVKQQMNVHKQYTHEARIGIVDMIWLHEYNMHDHACNLI